MLTVEERIALRDELFERLKNKHVIIYTKKGYYIIHRKSNLSYALNNDEELSTLYNLYISEFRSEEEAKYCLLHQDDYTNHICIVCKTNYSRFYVNTFCKYHYKLTCSDECHQKTSNTPEAQQKIRDTKKDRYGDENYNNLKKRKETCEKLYNDPNYTNREKAKNTNREKYGKDNYVETEEFKEKSKQTKKDRYGDEYYTNREKALQTNKNLYGDEYPIRVPEIMQKFLQSMQDIYHCNWAMENEELKKLAIENWKKTYIKNHQSNTTIVDEYQSLLNEIKDELTLSDLYFNDEYLSQFIKILYEKSEQLLKLNDLVLIFDRTLSTISKRIHELKLEDYFDIKDSSLELQFRDFLIDNGYVEDKDFERHLFSLIIDKDHKQQLDFLFKDYKIAFEINDIIGHNIKNVKDSNYHLNKFIMSKNQHDIQLIHIWEWELKNTKVLNWILHILNQNKMEIDLVNCIIKQVIKEEQIDFINQYDLNSYHEFDICIGLYYNNELIQLLSFNNVGDNKWYLSNICTKFGYNIKDGYKTLLDYFRKVYNSTLIYRYIDIAKEDTKEYKHMGFQFCSRTEPIIISENPNENSTYKQIYNCGYDIMIIKEDN